MIQLERWHQLSMAQQLGNIGSEIARARVCEEKGDRELRDEAMFRALDLIDGSLCDQRWWKRRREMARLREVVADWYLGTKYYQISPKAIENYCIEQILNQKS
jgi:hypothetical protein